MNLVWLARLPLVDHPDDLIVAIYGLVVLFFGIAHRRFFHRSARGFAALAAAAGCAAAAVVLDLLPAERTVPEETLELLAAALGLVALVLLGA
jgi:hypothetical protein